MCLKKTVVQSVEKVFRLHTSTSIYVVFGYGERFQLKKDCLEQFRIYIAAYLLEPATGPMVIMVVPVEKERYDNNVRLYSDRMKLRVVQPASVRITSVSH